MAPLEITITYDLARRMASVAAAANDDVIQGTLERDQQNAIHAVGRRLVADGGAPGITGVFGSANPDETVATLELDDGTFRTYLAALDSIATATATPHQRQACTAVFRHLVGEVDVDARGLHFQRYQTLEPKTESRVFG